MQLWKSLNESLKSKMLKEYASELKSDNVLAEKENIFGKVVADSLLQFEFKEWVYLEKKIMDVFFDYDWQKPFGYGPTLIQLILIPKKQLVLVKIITLICYLQTISSVINRQAQQLTKCFNRFRQNQFTHRIHN